MSRIPLSFASAALLLAVVGQLWIPLGHPIPGEFSDSVDYLVFADYFRGAFGGALTPGLVSFFSVTRFPPLFPLALYASGAGLSAPSPAYWLTALSMIGAFVLASAWLVRESRSLAGGLLLAAALALNPGLYLLSLNPVSEPMFLLLTLAVLLWSRRVESRRGSLLIFALFVGLLPLCRMAGVAIVIATAAWLWLRRVGSPRARIVAIAAMFSPAMAWLAYRKLMPVSYSYADVASLDHVLAVFGGWRGWIFGQPQRIAAAYIESMSPWAHLPAVAIIAIALIFGIGFCKRLAQCEVDALALGAYLALVYCWPYPAELPRLVVVTLPMVLLCVWQGVLWLVQRLAAPELMASVTVLLAVAMISGSFVVEAGRRALAPAEPELEPFKRSVSFFLPASRSDALEIVELSARVAALMDEIASIVRPGECVYTFFTNALAVHAPAIDARTTPYPPREGAPLKDQLGACRYVLVTYQSSSQERQPLLYPLDQSSEWMRPALVSHMRFHGREITAAALLERPDVTPAN